MWKKLLEPAVIVLIGGMITSLCTYLAQNRQEADSKRDKDTLQNQLRESNKKLINKTEEATNIQERRSEEIKELQRELLENAKIQVKKQEELTRKSEEYATTQKTKDGEIIELQRSLLTKSVLGNHVWL